MEIFFWFWVESLPSFLDLGQSTASLRFGLLPFDSGTIGAVSPTRIVSCHLQPSSLRFGLLPFDPETNGAVSLARTIHYHLQPSEDSIVPVRLPVIQNWLRIFIHLLLFPFSPKSGHKARDKNNGKMAVIIGNC